MKLHTELGRYARIGTYFGGQNHFISAGNLKTLVKIRKLVEVDIDVIKNRTLEELLDDSCGLVITETWSK